MQRFTISLDDDLAHTFDQLIAERGYVNRSEAVRDLIRERLDQEMLERPSATWCVATVSFVFDHRDTTLMARLMTLQHDQHDLVVSSLHTHLDHDHGLETIVLRGPTASVQAFAQQILALRGVRHGATHLVPLEEHGTHRHASPGPAGERTTRGHAPDHGSEHSHWKPYA